MVCTRFFNINWFAGNCIFSYYKIVDACLKDYEFFRLKDPYTDFQEIQMYLGSVLSNNQEKIPKIDDKTLAQAKGFDKWSFRKEPSDVKSKRSKRNS